MSETPKKKEEKNICKEIKIEFFYVIIYLVVLLNKMCWK